MPTRINDRYQLPDIGDDQLDAERSMAKVIFGLANSDFSIEEVFFIREWCEKFLRYAERRRVDDDLAVVMHPPAFAGGAIAFDTIFEAAKILEDRAPLKVEVAQEEPGETKLGETIRALSEEEHQAYIKMRLEPFREAPAPRLGIVARRLVTQEEFLKEIGLAPDAGAVRVCGCGAPEPHTPGGIHCRK